MSNEYALNEFDLDAKLTVAERLETFGFHLRHPEILEAEFIDAEDEVLWAWGNASDGSDTYAFSHIVSIDYEMIYTDDDYPDFIQKIAQAAGVEDQLSNVSSRFSENYRDITVTYTFDDKYRELNFEQLNDWIPEDVADFIIKDITTIPGRVRLGEYEGQGLTLVWIYPDKLEEFLALEPDFQP